MIESVKYQQNKSMLGYAKIRLETGAKLSLAIVDDLVLKLTAEFPKK